LSPGADELRRLVSELGTRAEKARSMRYSEAFKAKMVQKMSGPDGMSGAALARDVGVAQSTLSRWQRDAGRVAGVSKRKKQQRVRTGSASASGAGRRPDDWTAAEKLEAVMEAAGLSDDELGEYLRRKGLHQAQLEQWREQVLESLGGTPRRRGRQAASPEAKRLRELEKELRRKDKALAEAAALLVLKKKAQAIWGDEDDDTDPRNGK
jgi:transposase